MRSSIVPSRLPALLLLASLALPAAPDVASAFPRYMFAWADQPTTAGYAPPANWAYSSMGEGFSVVEREGVGVYRLSWSGVGHEGFSDEGGQRVSARHVTAYGIGAEYCVIDQGALQRVACYDAGGAPADTRFSVMLVGGDVGDGPALSAVTTFEPSEPVSMVEGYVPGSGASRAVIDRTSIGVYEVFFEDFDLYGTGGGNVQVTADRFAAPSPGARCTVSSWAPDRAFVRCFDPAGVPADARFSVSHQKQGPGLGPVAWAWANDTTAASYTPSVSFAYNPAGGAITAQRSGTGVYSMTWSGFGALGLGGGNVQVTAYASTDVRCKVSGWSAETAFIRCFDTAGNPADTRYSVIYRRPEERTRLTRQFGFATVDFPGFAGPYDIGNSSINGSAYQHTQDPVVQTRLAQGRHDIEFTGMGTLGSDGGNAQATAHAPGERCKVEGWGSDNVVVRCFDGAGNPIDTTFDVALFKPQDDNEQMAYVWKSQPSAASEVADPVYAHNPSGGSIVTDRFSTGFYRVSFSGLSSYGVDQGAPMVTAYGTGSEHCKIVFWNGDDVDVRCMAANGVLVDSRFSLVWIKADANADGFAYALADLPAGPTPYAPLAAKAHNPSHDAIAIHARAEPPVTEQYAAFFRQFREHGLYAPWDGHALVSAVGADSVACSGVANWVFDASVEVNCTDSNGVETPSQFVAIYVQPVPVPEPSGTVLLLAGIAMAVGRARRRVGQAIAVGVRRGGAASVHSRSDR